MFLLPLALTIFGGSIGSSRLKLTGAAGAAASSDFLDLDPFGAFGAFGALGSLVAITALGTVSVLVSSVEAALSNGAVPL